VPLDRPTRARLRWGGDAADAQDVCSGVRARGLWLIPLLAGCAGLFPVAPANAPATSVQSLRVRVADDVALVADGEIGPALKDQLHSAVESELGRAGLVVVSGEQPSDLLVRIEARVRSAVYFMHGQLTLAAEHDGVAVGSATVGPDLHKEVDFPPKMAHMAVLALVHDAALVEFADKRTTPPGSTLVAHVAPPAPPPPPQEKAASADVVASAKQHTKQGTAYYNLDRQTEALAEYEAAYLAVPDPALLFNIAQCHRKLGHDKEAVAFYKTYLRNAPRAANRADVEKRIQEIEAGNVAASRPRRR
jgi:hypothetical protein